MTNQDPPKKGKQNFYLRVLDHLKAGLNPQQVCIKESISKQSLNYYISSLKLNGYIKKIGYGTWEVLEEYDQTSKKNNGRYPQSRPPLVKTSKKISDRKTRAQMEAQAKKIRGHAFMFTVQLPKIQRWNERIKYLKKHNIEYKNINIGGGGQSILYKGRKIWLTNKSIIIYETDSYIAETAESAKSHAIHNLLTLVNGLEAVFGCQFSKGGYLRYKVSKQHYGKMQDALAKQYNKEGKKLKIFNDTGMWFLIDNSYNLNESETVSPKTADKDMDGAIVPFFNSLKENPGYTPDLVLNVTGKLAESYEAQAKNMETYTENIVGHVAAIKDLGSGVRNLVKVVSKLDKTVRKGFGKANNENKQKRI